MKAKCGNCENYMQKIYTNDFGDQFWCERCRLEVDVDYDKGEIIISREDHGN
jgi:hypothetical protein